MIPDAERGMESGLWIRRLTGKAAEVRRGDAGFDRMRREVFA